LKATRFVSSGFY